MPVLLVCGPQPLQGASCFIAPEAERDAFLAVAPSATVVEVAANHHGVNTHLDSAVAISAFLATR